ncbi:hypothetical protein DSM43518_02326 [Mycobacterium marinum]|nr:hypothetical protein MM1218R_01161 [Mycobacterium marinum]CDM75304.1 hypothetical protein MMARE11_11560 [Mycobacterium marinum E11]AXN48571.1 hypothetical protein CCUG20998_01152 [Mycobacterium marinum]RFZ07254.1 hypothetical protein DE4381_02872 [Mycobacterium marinum]RFZ10012.1 hypothetical protein DSM43518_02326 [Mycobacterium marinum]
MTLAIATIGDTVRSRVLINENVTGDRPFARWR